MIKCPITFYRTIINGVKRIGNLLKGFGSCIMQQSSDGLGSDHVFQTTSSPNVKIVEYADVSRQSAQKIGLPV